VQVGGLADAVAAQRLAEGKEVGVDGGLQAVGLGADDPGVEPHAGDGRTRKRVRAASSPTR
jgi:hypothetical protein